MKETDVRKASQFWESLFLEGRLDPALDYQTIEAKEIREVYRREPRLVAKFDSSADLPLILKQHNYFILPVRRGTYALVRGNGFHVLEAAAGTRDYHSHINFDLETVHRGTSESQYLDYAQCSGLIEQVIGRGKLHPTIRGREGMSGISFRYFDQTIEVLNGQIEVDLGLEGRDCIVLLEAKSKTPHDFNIRQLYYPYRRFLAQVPSKTIIPVFFTYDLTADSYNFWIYEFTDPNDYHSIRLMGSQSYRIVAAESAQPAVPPPVATVYSSAVVPQADDVERLIGVVLAIRAGVTKALSIAEDSGIVGRQGNYYAAAAEALGLITKQGSEYRLTESGRHAADLDTHERNLYIATIMGEFPLVKQALTLLQEQGSISNEQLETIIRNNSDLSGSTPERRASTLKAWLRWYATTTRSINPRHI